MSACPMCTMWADGYNAIAPHVTQKANFVLIAQVGRNRRTPEVGGGADGTKSACCRAARLVSTRITTLRGTRDNILASACSATSLTAKSIISIPVKPRFTPAQTATQTIEALTSLRRSGISSTSCPKGARIGRPSSSIDYQLSVQFLRVREFNRRIQAGSAKRAIK